MTFFGLGWYTTSLSNGIEIGEVEVVPTPVEYFMHFRLHVFESLVIGVIWC